MLFLLHSFSETCEFEECEIDGVIKCIDPIDDPDKDCITTDEVRAINIDHHHKDNYYFVYSIRMQCIVGLLLGSL